MDSTRTRTILIGLFLLLVVGLPQAFAQNQVTFQVDMRMKMREGVFLPSSGDVVQVRDSFNGWGLGDTLFDPDNDSIFTKTLSLPIGPIEYKYFKTFRGGDGLGRQHIYALGKSAGHGEGEPPNTSCGLL
jgi:hypothetical protein